MSGHRGFARGGSAIVGAATFGIGACPGLAPVDMAARAAGSDSARCCMLISDEMTCRLFFTRWWISLSITSFS